MTLTQHYSKSRVLIGSIYLCVFVCLCVYVCAWQSQKKNRKKLCDSMYCVCNWAKSHVCMYVCELWLINWCYTLAWEPSLQEKASRWSLGISALWNALWTHWPPPPCHRHTLLSLEYCHTQKNHINNPHDWTYQRNTLPSLDYHQETENWICSPLLERLNPWWFVHFSCCMYRLEDTLKVKDYRISVKCLILFPLT